MYHMWYGFFLSAENWVQKKNAVREKTNPVLKTWESRLHSAGFFWVDRTECKRNFAWDTQCLPMFVLRVFNSELKLEILGENALLCVNKQILFSVCYSSQKCAINERIFLVFLWDFEEGICGEIEIRWSRNGRNRFF